MILDIRIGGRDFRVSIRPAGDERGTRFCLVLQPLDEGGSIEERVIDVKRTGGGLSLLDVADGRVIEAHAWARGRDQWLVQLPNVDMVATVGGGQGADVDGAAGTGEQRVCAPMPGRLLRVLVRSGDAVTAGQALVVIEAMKMENALTALRDGVIQDVTAVEGASVEAGRLLMRVV